MVPTARRLGLLYDVFVPDLPGWGRSSKPLHAMRVSALADTLVAWFDAVGLECPVLVANSFGCQVAVDLAARYANRVTLLVLLGPTVDPDARSLWRIAARWLLDIPLEPPSLAMLVARDLVDMKPRRFAEAIRRMLEDRIEQKLPAVAAPTLVVRGERDTTVPTRWAAEAARLVPDGQMVQVPGAAHTLNYNSPDTVTTLIHAFVQERALTTPRAGGQLPPVSCAQVLSR
jgi:2-hydroxy-6-oxonona-2,4-dienedioate hydrolase